jgi:hypothetical protein
MSGITCFFFPMEKVRLMVHRELENYFLGIPGLKTLMLLRRSFIYYLSSQVVYFVNPYYVFLIVNIVLWFTASICSFYFVKRWFSARTALLTGDLVATGTGFIYSVAQPFVLHVTIDQSNSEVIPQLFRNWFSLLRHPEFNKTYALLFGFFELYIGHLAKAFFVLPLPAAFIGLMCLDTYDRTTFYVYGVPGCLHSYGGLPQQNLCVIVCRENRGDRIFTRCVHPQ